jgi:hypothetical protein
MRVQKQFTVGMAACAMVICLATASSAMASGVIVFDQGFETDTDGWIDGNTTWAGNVERVASGTAGITSAGGDWHAIFNQGPHPANPAVLTGPFTQFDGYRDTWPGGFTASIDIYLDPTNWSDGEGFDYIVAANRQTGDHLRDFVWHVGMVGNDLLVNASNNSDVAFNAWKLVNENQGNNFTVTTADWYNFEHVFYNDGGNLAVDLNLLDSSGTLLYSITRNTSDDIATTVGGNRYGWFAFSTVDDLHVDNTQLSVVPLPAAAWAGLMLLGGMGGVKAFRRRREQA